MRINEPITAVETEIPGDEPLVSRTDPSGRITFANKTFVDVSGFTEAELIGAPHNIVRHPHMPAQAFANLWATLKAGRPWDGLVKNRTKVRRFLLGSGERHPGHRERSGDGIYFNPLPSDARRGRRRRAGLHRSAGRYRERHRVAGRRDRCAQIAQPVAGSLAVGSRPYRVRIRRSPCWSSPRSAGSASPAWPPRTACCARSTRTTWCRSTNCAASSIVFAIIETISLR